VRLPENKLLIPGVVSHATNVVEDPELVAERIKRYAGLFGRERVIAGTDCGFGGRVHPQIAWAKLQVLTEGAALASGRLWAKPTGEQVRRRVLGAHVDRTGPQGDPFLIPFFEAGTEHIWGALWNRPGLDLKFRSLVVVSTLAATGHLHELQTHLRGALNLGWTADELREVLLQVGGYAGFPAAVEALRVLSAIVEA
jgi:alkylhydroperoxidase/carboxymuconolactone decarboxylase family protein YurZ